VEYQLGNEFINAHTQREKREANSSSSSSYIAAVARAFYVSNFLMDLLT
jgi:hypothetical protein